MSHRKFMHATGNKPNIRRTSILQSSGTANDFEPAPKATAFLTFLGTCQISYSSRKAKIPGATVPCQLP